MGKKEEILGILRCVICGQNLPKALGMKNAVFCGVLGILEKKQVTVKQMPCNWICPRVIREG